MMSLKIPLQLLDITRLEENPRDLTQLSFPETLASTVAEAFSIFARAFDKPLNKFLARV
jgi:hypothetical protein